MVFDWARDSVSDTNTAQDWKKMFAVAMSTGKFDKLTLSEDTILIYGHDCNLSSKLSHGSFAS